MWYIVVGVQCVVYFVFGAQCVVYFVVGVQCVVYFVVVILRLYHLPIFFYGYAIVHHAPLSCLFLMGFYGIRPLCEKMLKKCENYIFYNLHIFHS